jgi:tetratricopeptide (TPR) repeat protein
MVLFEALKLHGLRYRPDANTPYTKFAADHLAVDHIQYPAELLLSKAGDCDDLSVLYASLLENAGVATALVDAPGHIFVLFDTGVYGEDRYLLPLDERHYMRRGERLWLPVEITALDQSFLQAWSAGAALLTQWSALERRRRVEDTATAWEHYPPAQLSFEAKIMPPLAAAMRPPFEAGYAALNQQIDAYLETAYLDPLQADPTLVGLWLQLTKVYIALRQYDRAIDAALDRLIDRRDDPVVYNQLGITYYKKGEIKQAIHNFQLALAGRPEDAGLQRNLAMARAALEPNAKMVKFGPIKAVGTDTLKAGIRDENLNQFYWLEE